MLRRAFFLSVLAAAILSGSGKTAHAQGWTFTTTVSHTGPGPCIPFPTLPPIVYYTKEACEYNRQNELNNNGDDWSAYGDGSCILVITCTPCVGSDIGGGPSGGSGGSTLMGNPGDVSITGLLTGNALFSPHDIKDIENWINEFQQRNRSLGMSDEGMNQITSGDVPLTGNAGFDRFYTEQMLRFRKPEQGGTLYLKEGQNTIDPNDLKNRSTGSDQAARGVPMSPEMRYGQKYADRSALFMDSENGAIDERLNLDPYIDFGRSAAVFGVGFLKKGAIPAIVIVDVLAEDIKHGVQLFRNMYMGENEPIPGTGKILWNTAENIATDVAGAFIGDKMGKVAVAATVKHAEGVLVSKGVLPGIAKISEKPKNIAESVSTGVSVMTGSIDLVDTWGETQKKLNNPGK
ncbi:MAG: hypothetical protein WAV93_03485 [Bacteroidales bacterium]